MASDIRRRLKDVLKHNKATVNSISHSMAEQRRLNRQINEDVTVTFETISSIIENFPELSLDWLITGKGEMYKDIHKNAPPGGNVSEPQAAYGNADLLNEVQELKKKMKELEEIIKEKNELIETKNDQVDEKNKLIETLRKTIEFIVDKPVGNKI